MRKTASLETATFTSPPSELALGPLVEAAGTEAWGRKMRTTRFLPFTPRWITVSTGLTQLPSMVSAIRKRSWRVLSKDARRVRMCSPSASGYGTRTEPLAHRLKAESVRRECEDSLRRLQTDVIDLYQIHWPEPDEDIEEGWTELARLQKEGKVRYIGVSNFSVRQMQRAQAIAPITSLQPPYSIVTRAIEKEILPFTAQNNIGVIVYSPMSAGLLTGAMTRERVANFAAEDWRRNLPNFQEPLLSRNLKLVERLRDIGNRHERTPGEVAIAWTLNNPAVTGAIVGFRSAKQVSGIIGAAEFRLLPSEMLEIENALKKDDRRLRLRRSAARHRE